MFVPLSRSRTKSGEVLSAKLGQALGGRFGVLKEVVDHAIGRLHRQEQQRGLDDGNLIS